MMRSARVIPPCLKPGILHLSLLLVSLPAHPGVALLYHHVDTNTPPITSIHPDQFERHLQILEEEGFTVLPLKELTETSLAVADRRKLAAITFDDAYISIYQHAWPMLKQRGWPFTIFVATEPVQTGNPGYMNWAQLKELAQNRAEIASHSHSHGHLIRRQPGEDHKTWLLRVRRDITRARGLLREQGFESAAFAWPYGEYNAALLKLITDLGMVGYGQQSGAMGPLSNPALLPRFPLSGIHVGEAAFRDKILSLPMPIRFPEAGPLLSGNYRPALRMEFVTPGLNLSRMTCYGPGGLMPIAEVSATHLIATPQEDVPVGRSRYNCTLPDKTGSRFHWFSQLWIRKQKDGNWYQEP